MSATTTASRDDLAVREAAVLADVPIKTVEKTIEQRVLRTKQMPARVKGGAKRSLQKHDVVFLKAMRCLKMSKALGVAEKKALAAAIRDGVAASDVRGGALGLERVRIHEGLYVDVDELTGDVTARTAAYLDARARFIVSDPEILGGTPVVRGTRVTVYALLGRVQDGEALDEIAADDPDLPLEAIEAAVIFAKAHPLRGRPSGRSWRNEGLVAVSAS